VVSARGYAPDTLVGRDREIARLERALDGLVSDQVRVLQISGEPGIGKSRLLAELARRAEARGYLVLDGQAAEFERDIPFGVIVDALNDRAAALEPSLLRSLDGETVRELAVLLPSLAGLVDEPLVHRLGSERYRAHYAIRALLEALARVQPVVLTLDDLHWADDASVEVIGHLARHHLHRQRLCGERPRQRNYIRGQWHGSDWADGGVSGRDSAVGERRELHPQQWSGVPEVRHISEQHCALPERLCSAGRQRVAVFHWQPDIQ